MPEIAGGWKDDIIQKIIKKNLRLKEVLALKLIKAGYNPDYVVIAERGFYDEKTLTIKYEFIPISRDIYLDDR